MSVFTDADLSRLHDESLNIPTSTGIFQLEVGKFQALLARLEAAEDALRCAVEWHGEILTYKAEYKEWQKARGK